LTGFEPVSFLADSQTREYGQFASEPTPDQLARHFYLDDTDRAFVAERSSFATRSRRVLYWDGIYGSGAKFVFVRRQQQNNPTKSMALPVPKIQESGICTRAARSF
jgi:Domain of unknown function (DUF4158)